MGEVLVGYFGLVRASAQAAIAFRARLVVWFLTGFFPLLLMAVWLTVVAGGGPPRGWTTGDFIAYYAAAAVLWHLSGQHVVWEWDADLRSGDLSVRLMRPMHPFHQYAASDLGYRVVSVAMLVPVLVVATLVTPDLAYHLTVARAVAVVAAVLLAYLLSLVMASVFALVGFWSTQTSNLWMLWWGVGSFLSGWVAPLALMPHWLRSTSAVLPFRTTMGFPVEVLTGRVTSAQLWYGFAVGLGWLGVFAAVYLVIWPRAIRRHQAVAG